MAKLWLATALLLLTACTQMGPNAIQTQRGSYIEAIALTDKQELLANIVRAKYNSPPIFLQIKSITASPSLELAADSEIRVGGDVPPPRALLKPRIVYKEDPTIFYTPLTGKEFTSEMLLPTGLAPIFLMLNNGFEFATVADLMFLSINDLSNSRHASNAEREQFRQAISYLAQLVRDGLIRVGTSNENILQHNHMVFLVTPEALKTKSYQALCQLLRITPRPGPISFEVGLHNSDDQISVNTRSLLAIINYLSNFVEVPSAHQERVWPDELSNEHAPINILSSATEPRDAALAVTLNGYWFYLDEHDVRSQNTLYLLRILFDMQAQISDQSGGLQLTLPVQ